MADGSLTLGEVADRRLTGRQAVKEVLVLVGVVERGLRVGDGERDRQQ